MKRPDTPLAATVGDSIKPKKVSDYMIKREAQQKVKERNTQMRDSVLNRQAMAQGKTRVEMQKSQERDKNKKDACLPGLNVGGANKRGATKGSCSTGESNKGESLKDTK